MANAADQLKLINYLNNGGNLYFESINIGYDYSNTAFFEYLGIHYLDDGEDEEVVNLKGGCNNCSENLKFDYRGGISPHYSVDRLESQGGELLFSSEDGIGRVFINETADYKVITSSVVVAAVANADSLNLKEYLFSEYINYFMGYNPITTLKENMDEILHNHSNAPNPFSNFTNIEFLLEKPGIATVTIYNMNGQVVDNILNTSLSAGLHSVRWDATDQKGNKVERGSYFYSITTQGEVYTGKIIFIR